MELELKPYFLHELIPDFQRKYFPLKAFPAHIFFFIVYLYVCAIASTKK